MPLFARHFPVVVAGRDVRPGRIPLVHGPDILRAGLGERQFGASLVPGPFLDIGKVGTLFSLCRVSPPVRKDTSTMKD